MLINMYNYSINFKGEPNPKDKSLVKITMIFFKTGYPRVTKVINVTGLYKDWDKSNQNFKAKSSDAADKNAQLSELKMKYLEVVEQWEKENRLWAPVQWSHYYDKEDSKKEEVKVLTIAQMIEEIIETKNNTFRMKNGVPVSCKGTADTYKDVRNTLIKFTKEKYNKDFSMYYFEDINEKFLMDYIFYLMKKGKEKGNKGGVPNRLKKFCGVFYYAGKKGIPDTSIEVFDSVRLYMKDYEREPQTIPAEVMEKIETLDRSELSEEEIFHLDLYLFCYYTGGIAPVDMADLTWDSLQNDIWIYERHKVAKTAKMPFTNKAKQIAKKYKSQCFDNFVLPIYTEEYDTEDKKHNKITNLSNGVCTTLEKIAGMIGYKGEIKWYSARGIFITKMKKKGFEAPEIAIMAGNSPATIYKNYYKPKDNQTIRKEINQIFG